MSQQQPLALTDVAHGEQKGWRRHTQLVDALPYVDGLSPAEKAAVDKLIEEEVRSDCLKGSCSSHVSKCEPQAGWRHRHSRSRLLGSTSTGQHLLCCRFLQMRSSSKKPSDYLSELPPLPEPRFKVRAMPAG